MAKNIYVGVNSVARKVANAYVGINGVARKVTKGYVGVNGTAQQFYTSQDPYIVLNYIESNGTQYIDTGIVRNITKKYEMKGSFSFSDVQTRQLNGAQGGTYIGVVGGCYQITQGGTSNTGIVAPTNTFVDFDITFDCGNQVWYGTINSVTINTKSKTFDDIPASAHFHLFSLNGFTLPCSEKIAWWKLYENNTLIRDYIPVLDRNNVACLFDKVSNTFFYNQGTGNFSYGTL